MADATDEKPPQTKTATQLANEPEDVTKTRDSELDTLRRFCRQLEELDAVDHGAAQRIVSYIYSRYGKVGAA